MSLLHVLFYIHSAGSLEMLLDTEGGAQQDRFVGRLAARGAADGGRARLGAVVLGAPVRRSSTAPTASPSTPTARSSAARRAIVALAADACRADRLRPAAAGLPRPAHPAHAAGHGRQVHGDLRRAVLARDGLTGQATSDTGPVKLTFDNSPPDGSARRAARLPRGPPARELGRAAGGTSGGAAVIDCFARLFGPRAARPERLRRAALGRGGVVARLLRLLHADRRLDRLRPGPARSRSARSTGRARRRRRSGTATWTARCARASAPPARCWSA